MPAGGRLDPATWAPALLALLGPAEAPTELAPPALKRQTFAVLQELFLRGSHRQPVLLTIEDLHWLDPTSEEWLTALVERLPGAALLLLTTARPGYQAPWLHQPAVTQLALAPLRPLESQQMVQTLLATATTEAALGPVLVAKAGGNPLFLEELAWAAAAHEGALTHWAIPETIQEALRHGVAPGVRCLVIAANTLWCLGAPAQALRQSQEALTLAQELTHPQTLTMVHHFVAFLHYQRREAAAVQAHAEVLLTLATAQELPLWIGHGTCWRGWALAIQGQGEAGMEQLRQGLAAVLATGQTLTQPLHLVLLAEAAGHAGQVEAGLRLLAEALTAFEASGRADLLAEAYRLQGELLLHQAVSDTTEAEACFNQALTIARRQQAKSWELRAATSLSRLWQQQGKRVEARAVLAEVYGWFTEGFDTADLQEAKALLEALGERKMP